MATGPSLLPRRSIPGRSPVRRVCSPGCASCESFPDVDGDAVGAAFRVAAHVGADQMLVVVVGDQAGVYEAVDDGFRDVGVEVADVVSAAVGEPDVQGDVELLVPGLTLLGGPVLVLDDRPTCGAPVGADF